MKGDKLQKKVVDKIGRIFAMLFNRAIMYNMNHPYTNQSIGEFHKLISSELDKYSPIVIIMHQDSFFIEDEPLDPRVNTSKMLAHYKKAGINSLSFEKGLSQDTLEAFFEVFIDLTRFPNADIIKETLEKKGIRHAKVNHVFFKKVTADDEVLSRDDIRKMTEAQKLEKQKSLKKELLEMITGGLAMDDLGKSFSVTQLLSKPEQVSDYLFESEREAQQDPGGSSEGMFDQIHKIKNEVDKAAPDLKGAKLHELAASVMKMKEELLRGINEKKMAGAFFVNEEQIVNTANDITDKVILELVKDEYKQGATSISRLSQILRRLIPDTNELQRLLPKLKEVLLLEGMSLNDFLELTDMLEKELANAAVSQALKKSAEDIGVSGEELLREVTSNPSEAAELIYLASELRKETGDKKALTELLVGYIEKIGGNIAVDTAEHLGETGSDHLKSILSDVQSEIVDRLKSKDIETHVMSGVADRLNSRMDKFLEKLESNLSKRHSALGTWDHETTSLLRFFEENVSDTEELKSILKQLRDKYKDIKSAEIRFDIFKEDSAEESPEKTNGSVEPVKKEQALPKGVHNRKSTLYFIEKEILRSSRYQTPFSVVTMSILKAVPQKKFVAGTVTRDDITASVLENLVNMVRDTDLLGILDKKRIVTLMPMTDEDEAKLALRRLLRTIHSNMVKVNDVPLEVKFAGSVTSFEKNLTPSLKEYIKRVERDIYEMVQRLKNLQILT